MLLRAIVVSIAALLAATAAHAEPREPQWVKLQTIPYTLNNKQDAISFVDARVGWYGNGTGRVYRTSDAGEHWTEIWAKPGTYVRALDFADAHLGFLGNIGANYYPDVSDDQPLYVTHDGGHHWDPAKLGIDERIKGVCAIDILKIDGRVAAIRAGGRVGVQRVCWSRSMREGPGRHVTCAN